MLERGSGAVLFALGTSARQVAPALASSAVPQAGLLAHARNLDASVRPRGVAVGALLIGGLITGSAAAGLFDQGRFEGVVDGVLPRRDPDDLAGRLILMARPDGPAEVEITG